MGDTGILQGLYKNSLDFSEIQGTSLDFLSLLLYSGSDLKCSSPSLYWPPPYFLTGVSLNKIIGYYIPSWYLFLREP